MRAVVQRVKQSSVIVDDEIVAEIGKGLLVLLGISKDDGINDIKWLADKIVHLRIFEDELGKMNKSVLEVGGELLVVSQFTLYGDCRKGRRPNYMEALSGEEANKLYEAFVEECKKEGLIVQTGIFGANMEVNIVNDGPVTLLIDSKKNF